MTTDILLANYALAAMNRECTPRRKSAGLWPACGARLRKERTGQFCKASGNGFGARCILHGGCAGGRSSATRFVLFASLGTQETRRWSFWAVPLHWFERLPLEVQARPEPESVRVWLERLQPKPGAPRYDRLRRWPQPLGFRIVKRLAERDRLAFVLFSEANRTAALRATRESLPRPPLDRVPERLRVDGATFAAAMAQAGHKPKPRGAAPTEGSST